jgi:uncharacterized protein (TIGR00725 family)
MSIPAPTLFLDRAHRCLHDGAGLAFDSTALMWRHAPHALAGAVIEPIAAVRWLQKESSTPSRQPIGVIGARHATTEQAVAARAGQALAEAGLTVLCGGRRGVMLAVCEGVAVRGGISVGLLPGESLADGNRLSIPIPTGIGLARNALIARGSLCLVAIGGSYGTLSEVALGIQFGKRVFGLEGAPHVEGVEHLPTVDAAMVALARVAGARRRIGLPYEMADA